ncbi:lipoprotein [Spirochaetia bacterium]|nr:lipoprotein [Spirochaetia bacterium]
MNTKAFLSTFCASVFWGTLFFSCAALPAVREVPEQAPPERPEIPPAPEYILGQGQIPQDTLALFLESINPEAEKNSVEHLAGYYIEESAVEGVNHDIAFAQMCLETGFLRYGNLVTADMNNFCGLGAIGPEQTGEHFPEPRIGVRAHIQHLKAYATDAPLKQELVDPRYRWVRYGSAPTIHGLAGTWATDKSYAKKIAAILERLYQFAYEETGTQIAALPPP